MHRSRGLSVALALTVAAAGLGVMATAPKASAITPPVAFTADDLPTWQTNGIVWALAQADGVVFAGGTFSAIRPPEGGTGTPQSVVNFAAFDAATGAPTGCKLNFTVNSGGNATVRALAVSPDKKTLYAGGYFGEVNGTQVSSLAAIDIATCTPKASFKASFPATVRALAVTDDTVYAAGDFTTVGGQKHERFAAVQASDGSVLPFAPNADEPGRAIQLTPDGTKAVIGGDFFTVNGTNSHALAVVDAKTGALAKTYPGFIETNSVVKAIETDATGIYTGNEGTGLGVFDGRIALNASDLNQRWRDTCLGATQALKSYKGVLYSASHAHDCSGVGEFPDGRRHHFLAEPTTGTGKLGWFPDTNDGNGEQIGPRALAVATSGSTQYLWSGGEFTTVNGAPAQSLTRFASTGDTGKPSVPVVRAASEKPGEVEVRWRASVDTDDSKLTYKVYRNGSTTPLATVQADSLLWDRPQVSIKDTSVSADQSYSYRVTASDAAGNTSSLSATATATASATTEPYPAAVLGDGAQLYWRYDDSSSPFTADSSAGNSAGTQLNAPVLRQVPAAVSGPSTAIGLNGSNQQVYDDHRFAQPTTYSLETWFKTTSTSGGKLIGFGDNTEGVSAKYDKHVYMTNAGKLVFGVSSGGLKTLVSPKSYNDGKWHQAVATQGSGGMALYVDGHLLNTNSVTTNQNYTGFWHVGGDNLAGWPSKPTSNFFKGQLDETAIYPKALTSTQVAHHYTLASTPADTVTTVPATADTYVNAGAAGTNYGAATSLAVRKTSAYETYLRFALPKVPAGTKLASARLQVKTDTSSGAGSSDTISVSPVTGTWSPTSVTYTTRPALSSTAVGTLTGATQPSTLYSADLNTATLAADLGSSYDLALTSDGTDALWLWASQDSAAQSTPNLVLTFSPK
ncbi:DNRLRE domain-containing protein [Streptomyces sp. NBC_01471]|uniref:CBM96 family carbohydrate-binding protein n=1 Tax=Streptomyces sp. NBC_01471 TaxID=2903879 RepID=UPI003244F8CB